LEAAIILEPTLDWRHKFYKNLATYQPIETDKERRDFSKEKAGTQYCANQFTNCEKNKAEVNCWHVIIHETSLLTCILAKTFRKIKREEYRAN